MQTILTFKIQSSLLNQLETASKTQGLSKGALIRQALEKFFNQATSESNLIEKITSLLSQDKKPKLKVNWKKLREKASATPSPLTPEAEILALRRRRL